jgi:glycerate kinase
MRGKVVSGVARVAREGGARVAVIASQVELSERLWQAAGIGAVLACMSPGMDLPSALGRSEELLSEAAGRFARRHLAG